MKVSKLSDLIEERQRRYLGHIQRYPNERWAKLILYGEAPGQRKTGKYKQWTKEMSAKLIEKGFNTEIIKDRKEWRETLNGLYQSLELK